MSSAQAQSFMGSGSDLAQPPEPVFIRTRLITGEAATAAASVQQALLKARVEAQAVTHLSLRVTNWTVAQTERRGEIYRSQVWVTIKSIH